MNGRHISSSRPDSGSKTASKSTSASKTLLNDHYIHRIVTDPSAGLGSFYDARMERVLGKLTLGKTPITKTPQHKNVTCTVTKNDTFGTENLFRKIGIYDEPWLNSILNIIPSHGIASVVNYSFPKTTNTRIVYYYYISEEQSIPPVQNKVRASIPKDIPDITATHVISARRVGIQALIVLQLPLNNETDFDYLLENIAQQLIQNKFEPRREEKTLLECITVTKIFSNIPDLNKMTTFTGICQKITAIKPHIYCHYPMEFTLRTIQWFYPLYSIKKAKYIPVEPGIVKKIKNHLLSLSSQIQELKISLDLRDNEIRKKHLNEQYDACRQQIADVEKIYSNEIERIRDLVIKIRSGTMKREFIEETLINTTEQSLQSNINLVKSRLQSLRETAQQNNKFDKQNTKYVDKHQLSDQQRIDTNEESKPVKLSAASTSQVTLDSNEQSKKIERPFYLFSPSKNSSVENASSGTDSLNGVEQPSNLLTKPTSQRSLLKEKESTDIGRKSDYLRSEKILTTHRKVALNQETTHETEQRNESKPSIMTGPPVTPRSQRQGSNSNEPIRPTTPLKSSNATRIYCSEERPNHFGEHDHRSESSPPLISDATHPSKQHPVNNQEQSKSSNLPTSPSEVPPKIEKPVSRTASPNRSVTARTSSAEKQRVKVEDQETPPKSLTLSVSNHSLALCQQTEGDRKPFDTSIPPTQLDIENTLPRKEQLVSLEAATNQSRSSTSQSPPVPKRRASTKNEHQPDTTEPLNSSTTENATISNHQNNHEKELSNTSNSPRILTPQLTSQTERKSINDKEPLQPSPTRRSSASEEQLNYSGEHNRVLDSTSKLAFDAIQLPKERPEDSNKQPKASSSPTSSNLLDTEEIFSQNKQHTHPNEQHKSRPSSARSISNISLTMNQEHEDNKLFHSSISSKQSDTKNTSPQTLQFASVEDSTNRPRSPTPSNRNSSARKKRRSTMAEDQSNTTGLSNPSTTAITALSNEEITRAGELNNISHSPKILTPQANPQTKKKPINIEESLNQQRSSSKEESKCVDKQVLSSQSPSIVWSETAQSAEKQSENIEKQSNQLKSPRLLNIESTLMSEQQPNDVKQESNTQKSSRPSTPNATSSKRRRPNSSRSSTVKYQNILLLGESGVGKSTFINALLNYHAFNTFEEARSNQPFVAMPVSFLMTVGDQFEEKLVRFGGVDPNEDHDHPGQSVTQHCRSYVFQISPQTKLRIIDTPGMGDTRGLEQDDRNMQHILSFINNLPHLNAICILLKPNESRLTIAFRSYFTRLLNFLGENARNNIVFCFTNTRATFFAPGSTGPLLKEMIKNLPIKDISFAKTNTFCFDSEAFRYLVALQNGIKFDKYQENEYQQSWASSSTVSNRLLQYVCAELKPYSQKKWQSIEHAQFQINQLIRPMLETMRNLFRNRTLLKEKPSRYLIKLCPIVLSQPAAICYTCPRVPKRFSDFWILSDDLHIFADKCNDCDHSKKKHINIDYKFEYELIQNEGAESFDKMNWNLYQLRMAILKFSEFYGYVVDNLKQKDPMLSALKRIIDEESQICSEKDSTCLNYTLRDKFLNLKKEYKDRRTTTISVHAHVDLPSLYELIQNISEMDEISEQMHQIEEAQKRYLKQHEKQVS